MTLKRLYKRSIILFKSLCILMYFCGSSYYFTWMQRITAEEALNHAWFQEDPLEELWRKGLESGTGEAGGLFC